MDSKSIAERVRDRYLEPSLPERVASRYVMQRLATKWDGKFVGKDCRLQWSDAQWLLEELPQKGKKKLRVAKMQNPFYIIVGHASGVINLNPPNVLREVKLGASDDYDAVKKKIEKAMVEAAKADFDTQKAPEWVTNPDQTKWYENQVYFLEIVPENVEPFKVEGKDFVLHVSWTDFKAYSPGSDLQDMDPHYTVIKQKSPGAARKLYNTLKTEPTVLKSLSWDKFKDWLDTKKIGYDMNFSVWH